MTALQHGFGIPDDLSELDSSPLKREAYRVGLDTSGRPPQAPSPTTSSVGGLPVDGPVGVPPSRRDLKPPIHR